MYYCSEDASAAPIVREVAGEEDQEKKDASARPGPDASTCGQPVLL